MKKVLVLIALFMFAVNQASAQETDSTGVSVTVSVDNVPSDEGVVRFGLYDEQTFMVSAPIKGLDGTIKDGKTTVTFKNVAPGSYAVLCYHDKNGNDKMDFEANGMPAESYGASNNNAVFGPPTFSDSKFEVTDQPINLNIRF